MVTRGGRGREGRSQARQGRLRGNQNRQLNCRRRFRLLCRLQPSQELPGKSRGVPKLVAKPPVAGPSGNRSPPSSPTRTTRTGPRQVFPTHTSTPRSSTTGSTLLPAAPVEPPVTMEVPVEQVAQKRKASSPLPSQTVTRPVSPPSPRRWESAQLKPDQGEF